MCRRDTKDPLLSVAAKRGYTLLENPRQGVEPGDVWLEMRGGWVPSGHVGEMLDGGLDLPEPKRQPMGDLDGVQSEAIRGDVAVGVLAPALVALGFPPVVDRLTAAVQSHTEMRLQFSLSGLVGRELSLFMLARELHNSQVDEGVNALLTDGQRVGVGVAVLEATGLTVEAVSARGGGVDLGVDATLIASIGAGRKVDRVSASKLAFTGCDPIALGVRLQEVVFGAERRALRMRGVAVDKILGASPSARDGSEFPPPLLPGDEDLFGDL